MLGKRKVQGLKHALSRKAHQALAIADAANARAVVLAHDVDRGDADEMRAAISEGFNEAVRSEPQLAAIRSVVATPHQGSRLRYRGVRLRRDRPVSFRTCPRS